MKLRILVVLFLIASLPGVSQQYAFEYWHDGKVILDTGDTLKGQIKYDMANDLLQLQADKRLETFTARKILTFEIFDVTTKRYREFFTLPYALKGQYKAPILFELIAEGKMTVLAREALEVKTYSSYSYYTTYTRLVLVSKYFILKEDGSIQPISGKKNDFLELMGDKREMVEKFIKENKLDVDRKFDVMRIVEYYNSLFRR